MFYLNFCLCRARVYDKNEIHLELMIIKLQ